MEIEGRQHTVGLSIERQARYRWAAGVAAGSRVLDAACGSGWGTSLLARSAAEAVGIDLSPALIADARREHGKTARFEEADLRALPFEDGRFDLAVLFEALAHVADPRQVLDELRRVLRPEGTLLVSAPNREVYPPGNPLHLSEMTPAELESMLRRRFSKVATYCQKSYHASLIGTAVLLAHDDAEAPVAVEVRKLLGGSSGTELHAVAAASDGELPAEPSTVVLGEELDYEEQRSQLADWKNRAVEAEAKALALERELRSRQDRNALP